MRAMQRTIWWFGLTALVLSMLWGEEFLGSQA